MPLTPQELRQRRLASLATPTKAAPDAKALLDAANSASQTVAVLHVAFMAVCAYVLVIVSGTTDLDLLMGGNNVKLPVIDVAVPIVGFYAVAPYLVVLMHLNLLLQLQLLSRKLFAFDASVPAEEGVGGLRDRLHIFPYTYYLVGRPSVVVGGLIGLVVSVSLIVLPLATLLGLQLKFLAYQAEGITWAQRVAVFLDVGLLVALWPVILHPRDDWKAWWYTTLAKWAWLAVMVLFISVAFFLFAATPDLFTVWLLLLGAVATLLLIVRTLLLIVRNGGFPRVWLLRAILSMAVLLGLIALLLYLLCLIWGYAISLPALQPAIPVTLFLGALPLAFFWRPTAPRGSLALLSALVLAPLLALGLMVDGESWEAAAVETQKPPLLTWRMFGQWLAPSTEGQYQALAKQFERNDCMSIGHTMLSCVILAEQRRLDLNEHTLFAKPPNPELLAALRTGKGLEHKDKLERISLVDRSLRRARMVFALLVGADLRGAQLQGANLYGAELQGANLRSAQLQGAHLRNTQLQGANLEMAHLQGADLEGAHLQGADLGGAHLQGAGLAGTELQGANLRSMQLQGADLHLAHLQGADLHLAHLQGANLAEADLQGANLAEAHLQGADLHLAHLQGADLARAELQGANLVGSTLYANGNPAQSDLLDVRGTSVKPLSQEDLSAIQAILKSQAMLKSISYPGQKDSLQRVESAAEPGAEPPAFASCLTDGKSQPRCQRTYDATNLDQQREFMVRLHEVLATLACKDLHIASAIINQMTPNLSYSSNDSSEYFDFRIILIPPPLPPPFPISFFGKDSTLVGLATVLLARMKEKEPCPGLAGLSVKNKTKLEELVKKEAEQE